MIRSSIVISVEYDDQSLDTAELDREFFEGLVNQYFNTSEPFPSCKIKIDYTIAKVKPEDKAYVEQCL